MSGVTVIDTQTLKPVKQLLTGTGHHEIAVSEDNRVAFVTNRDAGTVSLIDVRELKILREVKLGGVPISVGYSTLSHAAYVADGKAGSVTVLAGRDFKPVKKIALRSGLGPMRFTPDGRHAFIVNTSEDLVHVIDTSSNELLHDIPISGQPYQVAFTRAFAYVRSLSDERVAMINLLSLGRGNKPAVQFFAAGATPPKAGGELPLADSIAPAIGDAAVMVVNPADNTVYYYMEGMNAPMGSYQSYGASARAVTVIDRSLKETEPGVYTSKVRIPVAGRYDVAFLLESAAAGELLLARGEGRPAARLAAQAHRRGIPGEKPRGAARQDRAGALHGEDRGRRAADRAEGPARAVVPRARTAPQRDHRARGEARRVRGDGRDPGARRLPDQRRLQAAATRTSRTSRTSPCAPRALTSTRK